MNLRIIRAIVAKDMADVLKNKSMATVLLVPIFVAALYAIINLAVQTPTRVLAYNPDSVPISDTLRLVTPRIVVDNTSRADEVRARLADKDSPYSYGVVIPSGSLAAIKEGQPPGLALYINGQKIHDYMDQQRATVSFFDYFQTAAGQTPGYAAAPQVVNPAPITGRDYQQLAHQNGALFAAIALALVPIGVGIYLLPGLLVEEKEKKTIRLLLASQARSLDIVLAKSFVSFFYTIALSLVVVIPFLGYISDAGGLLLFIVLGNLFAAAVGIVFGAYFNDIQTVYAWVGVFGLILMWPIFFALPFLSDVPILSQLAYAVPTYYLTKGLFGTANGDLGFETGLLYAALLAAFTVVALLVAAWVLRRRTVFA